MESPEEVWSELPPPNTPSLHPSMKTTLAETKVREAAAAIGIEDEGRLSSILQRMKEEDVVYAWQLPLLEASDWKALGFSIGLTAAVRQMMLNRHVVTHSQSSVDQASPSPKSAEESLLDIDLMDKAEESIFEDQEEMEEYIYEEDEEKEMDSLLDTLRRSRNTPIKQHEDFRNRSFDAARSYHAKDSSEGHRGDKLSLCLFPGGKGNKENAGKLATHAANDFVKSLKPAGGSSNHPPSSGSPGLPWRRSSLPLPKIRDLPDGVKQGNQSPVAPPYVANPEFEARRFQEEWEEVEAVLAKLSVADHRAILGQLIIVANGQTQAARVKMVENVITRLRSIFAQRENQNDDLDLILDHMRHFARLRSELRKLFGKFLFTSLSQLHAPAAQAKAPETTTQQEVPCENGGA